MNMLERLFNTYKDSWITRQINGYKSPVYYRFLRISKSETEIELIRYYPLTKKWQYDTIIQLGFLAKMSLIEDEKTMGMLDAEYALFLLIKER